MDAFLNIAIPAAVGLISGAIGSLVAPWVQWGIDKRRQQLTYRRELVSSWRRMVQEVARAPQQDDSLGLAHVLERQEAFYSLKPHLSRDVASEIYRGRTKVGGSTINAGLAYMLDEIGRIEKEWGLV